MTTFDSRRFIFWIITIGLGLASVGCVRSKNPDDPRTLRFAIQHEPATLDFSLAEDGASFRFFSAMMSGLVRYDAQARLKLEMASRMDVLEKGRVYRFHLKPWKWSDGVAVTAADYVFALRRTLDPETPAKLADFLFAVEGARLYKRGALKDFSKVGIRALAPDELEFKLEKPVANFAHVLTLSIGLPQRQDVVKRYGARWPEHAVSTGPFRISKWVRDQSIEMERNPEYSGQPLSDAAPLRLAFQVVGEESTALSLFENGKADVLFKVPSLDLANLKRRDLVREYPYFATYYLAFDQRQKPWNDRNARLAVAQSLDREAIVKAIGEPERAATSWIPVGMPGHDAAIGVKYDAASAQASWKRVPQRPASVKLGFDSGSRNEAVVVTVGQALKQTLGLEIKLQQRDWKTYLRELSTEPPPIFRFGWLAPFIDAAADLAAFVSTNPNNYTGWKSAKYDALIDRIAALEADRPERAKLIEQAHRLLIEQDVVVVPIFHYVQSLVVAKRVRQLPVDGIGVIDYTGIQL